MNNINPTIAQALAAFAPPQSEVHRVLVTRFNDDDIYEFDADTLELFAQHSPQRADLAYLIPPFGAGTAMLHNGHMIARGMRIKSLKLWQRRIQSGSVPKFLTVAV